MEEVEVSSLPEQLEEVDVRLLEVEDQSGFVNFLHEIKDADDAFSRSVPRDGLSANSKRRATRLEKKYEGQADAGTKQHEHDQLTSYEFFEVAEPPYNLEYLAKLYEVSSAHASCVRIKVANTVGLGYKFHETEQMRQELAERKGDKRREAGSRLAELKLKLWKYTEDLHQEDTFTETLRKMWTDVETTGNGYLEISYKRNGEIGYIGHIPSHTMRVRRARDGFVQIMGRQATFFRHFGADTEDPIGDDPRPNEVIHFKKYNPSNPYYGIPDIIPAIGNITGNEFAEQFNVEYFENKAVPRYVIITKNAKLSKDAERRMLQFFQSGLKGKHHRSVYVPLSEAAQGSNVDLKIEPVEADVQDASFVKYFKLNDEQIYMAHGVPMTKGQVVQGVSLAAARDADKTFKEQIVRPWQQHVETKMRKIWERKTDAVWFKLVEMTLTDEDTASKIWERRLKTQEATPNEARAARGEIGRVGGDEVIPVFDKRAPTGGERARARLRGDERDAQRGAAETDAAGEGRNAKGDGRANDE